MKPAVADKQSGDSLSTIWPELYLGFMALLLLMGTVGGYPRAGKAMLISTLVALVGTALLLWRQGGGPAIAFNGLFATCSFIVFSKFLILAAAVLVLLVSGDWLREDGGKPRNFLY